MIYQYNYKVTRCVTLVKIKVLCCMWEAGAAQHSEQRRFQQLELDLKEDALKSEGCLKNEDNQ